MLRISFIVWMWMSNDVIKCNCDDDDDDEYANKYVNRLCKNIPQILRIEIIFFF